MINSLVYLADIVPVSAGIYAVVISLLVFMGAIIAGFIFYITKKPIAKDGEVTKEEAESKENE